MTKYTLWVLTTVYYRRVYEDEDDDEYIGSHEKSHKESMTINAHVYSHALLFRLLQIL